MFEAELADDHPQTLDMRIYDEAYSAMEEREDVDFVLDCARRYFRGERSANPVLEIMSEKSAKAVNDITEQLHT